jgi:hypothetical protein
MVTLVKAIRAIAIIALPLALIGAVRAPAPITVAANGSVTIANPGGSDRSGFLIVIDPTGRAWALDGAGHSAGYLQRPLAAQLFADLAAAGPLSRLPDRTCSDEVLVIGWNGQRSPNLSCSADAREAKLAADVLVIQHALYVQSYHTAGSLATGSAGSSAYSTAGYNVARSSSYPQSSSSYAAGPASYGGSYQACVCSGIGGSYVDVGGSGFQIAGITFTNDLNSVRFSNGGSFSNTSTISSIRSSGSFNNGNNFSSLSGSFNGNNGDFRSNSSDLHSSLNFNTSPGLSGSSGSPGSYSH